MKKYYSNNELDKDFEVWEIEGIECWLIHKNDNIYHLLKHTGFDDEQVDYKKVPSSEYGNRTVTYFEDEYQPMFTFYQEIHKVLHKGESIPYMLSTTEY